MIPFAHYRARRDELLSKLDGPVLLFAGGPRARNYPDNTYPYRADSHFLFFFPHPETHAAALFDPADGTVTLYLTERTLEDALWMGPVPSFEEMRETLRVDAVVALTGMEDDVRRRAGGRAVGSVAVADSRTLAKARRITGSDLVFGDAARTCSTEALRDALSGLRMRKRGPEIDELRRAGDVSAAAFRDAMALTRPGVTEQQLHGVLEGAFLRGGGVPSFTSIVSVRGEILHNHRRGGTLRDGDMVLIDAGAEMGSGYGADLTRAWPANGRFSGAQRDVYELVLAAETAAIEAVRPGARFRDVHLTAARVLAAGLVDLGLLRGDADTLVERGAHALFFPHGVGHLLGLDAHDLESFGDAVLYGEGRQRSTQFGTAFLRIDLDLEEGMVVTIEPGCYFVPGILRGGEFRRDFASWSSAPSENDAVDALLPDAARALDRMGASLEEMGRYFADRHRDHLKIGCQALLEAAEQLVRLQEEILRAAVPQGAACPRCGTANEPGVRACSSCGAVLPEIAGVAAQTMEVREAPAQRASFAHLVRLEEAVEGDDREELKRTVEWFAQKARQGRKQFEAMRAPDSFPTEDARRISMQTRDLMDRGTRTVVEGVERMERHLDSRPELRAGLERVKDGADLIMQ
ncbi:aminopeptidase P N-terminal domain-containing protein, partial [bacterium]|nr:aminopeptidase P N-terminal domain-containing protein [bacterium]